MGDNLFEETRRAVEKHEPSLKLKRSMLTRDTMCSASGVMFHVAPSVRCCENRCNTKTDHNRTVVDDAVCSPSTLSQEDGSIILFTDKRDVTREVSMHCNICHRIVFALEDSPVELHNGSDRCCWSHTFISVYVCRLAW